MAPNSTHLVSPHDARCHGDADRFAWRVTRQGLDRATIGCLTDAGAGPTGAGAALLSEVLCNSADTAMRPAYGGTLLPRDRAFTPADSIPFEHVWAPLLRVARRRVRRLAGRPACARLTGRAHAGFERALLGRLSDLSTRTLDRAFASAHAERAPGAYPAFVRAQLGGGLRDLFAAYPVLARLVATLAADWVVATTELLARLAEDAPALAAAFGDGRSLGMIARVDAGLSDPHGGGRQVAILYPARGHPVVYKPRSLAFDAAYAALVRWLADALPPATPAPGALRVLDRGTHGWAEYVAPGPCADAAGVRRYFERAGAVLCLAHVLRAGDLHQSNVVADGEHPLLIDADTLCGPVLGGGQPSDRDRCEPSVLDTGLLPVLRLAPDGTGHVERGIAWPWNAAPPRTPNPLDEPGWVHVNTNGVHWGTRPRATDAPAVARGFRRTYRVLQAFRGELLADDGPLAAFADGSSRTLPRRTLVYTTLLRRAAHPSVLRDEAIHAAELAVLRRPSLRAIASPLRAPALDAECEALQRLDVPLFTVPASGTALHAPGRGVVVPEYARASGYEGVYRGVREMSGARLRRELQYVRIALAADRHRHAWSTSPRRGADVDAPVLGVRVALEEANRLAALLRELAVTPRAGVALWYAHDIGGGQRDLSRASLWVESGQAGIALFFAAHARVLRARNGGHAADEAAAWARAASAPVCDAARRCGIGRRPARAGFGVGWGGAAYALACVARLTDDAGALVGARAALDRLRLPRRRAPVDVFGGAAGAVLGALAVHAATGDADDLAVAAAWGDVLLARWPRADDGVDGFGHGRAGAAAALLRLAARSGDGRYAPAAVRTSLSPRHDGHAGPNAINGWCRGPAGSGLALAAALASGVGTRAERSAWRSALAHVAAHCAADDRGPWTLCCGTLARIDLLLATAAALRRPALTHDARALAARVVTRARRRLSYASPAHAEPLVPGLLRGIAGVGYMLLRTASPGDLPSPLLADMPRRAGIVAPEH